MMQNERATPPARTENDRRVFARLGEILAASIQWRDELLAGPAVTSPAGAIEAFIGVQAKRKPQIEAVFQNSLAAIRSVFAGDVVEHEWGAGTLTTIDLLWKEIDNIWLPDKAKPQETVEIFRQSAGYLDDVVYECTRVVLTPNINDRLVNLDIGQPLDVEFVFGESFPVDHDHRLRLLREVVQERGVLATGMVDLERGVIFRVAAANERWKSYLREVLVVLFCLVVVAGLPLAGRWVTGWPFSAQPRLLIVGYLAWVIGAFLHVLILALRQQRASKIPSFAVMDDWFLWLHVKERSIVAGVIWITLGYVLMYPLLGDLGWQTALFAGYGADSLTEMFVERFTALSASVVKSMTDAATAKTESASVSAAK